MNKIKDKWYSLQLYIAAVQVGDVLYLFGLTKGEV